MQHRSRLSVLLALVVPLLAAGLVAAPAAADDRPVVSADGKWQIRVLPTLETSFGELVDVRGRDLNERGQVAGVVRNRVFPSAAFRYTPGVGMEDLDPRGAYNSESTYRGAINEHGDVLGNTRNFRRQFTGIFLHRPESGFDFLTAGQPRSVRRRLEVFGGQPYLPDAGHICAFNLKVKVPGQGKVLRPYLWVPGEGWTDLSALNPRFQTQRGAWCKYTNQRGDVVLTTDDPPAPGEDPPFGHQETYVLTGGTLHKLPTLERPIAVTAPPNEAGLHVGGFIDGPGRQHAFVWTPERGAIRFAPAGEESWALAVNERSRVVGILGQFQRENRVFTYTEREGLRMIFGPVELQTMLARYGQQLQRVSVDDQNNRGAIVGTISTIRPDSGFPYYYSPADGLVDLKAVIESFDVDFHLTDGVVLQDLVEINDRGDILIVGEGRVPRRRLSTAILTRLR